MLKIAGVKHVSGDMFESIPTADAIFMKVCIINFEEFCLNSIVKRIENLSNLAVDTARLGRRGMREDIEELLESVAREWKSDGGGVFTPGDS